MTMEPWNTADAGPWGFEHQSLRYKAEFPVLGITVRLATDAAGVIDAAVASFGSWRALARYPELVESHGVEVRLVVCDGPGGGGPLAYHRPDEVTLHLNGAGCVAFADARRGRAAGYVTTAVVDSVESFRYTVLEALTLFLVTGANRYPLHASAIVRDGIALLLAGPGGAGKSTLAWAARSAGWQVLSDDVVYVQSAPSWRVWGAGSRLYIAAEAAPYFPELTGGEPALRIGGRDKLVMPRALPMPPVCERAGVCLLVPGHQVPGLEPLTEHEALEALTERREPGFDVFTAGAAERLAPLSRHCWRLELSPDPRAALPLLDEVFAAL